MRKYNISANLVRTIEQLYDKAKSAVQMNGSIGEWFRTTVGVRQWCLLSPTLFNIFLERIMSDALEEHGGIKSKANDQPAYLCSLIKAFLYARPCLAIYNIQRILVIITTVFVTKDFAVKSNLLL